MNELEQEIQAFFRSFALQVINDAKADATDPRAIKQAMLEHYEDIYPAFARTQTFKACPEGSERYKMMVEAYRHNFTILLEGRLP
ncbi:hypothetical protein JHU38_06815 [Prevotella sp. A2931]|uniref:Uncharacterized protein n=1 Tax=Prevotella illustrans TaxID=2800387 RepID=A0ABS3M5N2_9BACT|nr:MULTISPECIES: hypothetical protein [Prevotella]MBO1363484.1 hypothetical protein [Prevotella illustrans]PTL26068.1 hypothetical protein C3V39_02705 [Prevotella sp. oral taxon 820]